MSRCLTIPLVFRPFVARAARDLAPRGMQPTWPSGSFPASDPPRWRRRPNSGQQNRLQSRLTRLTAPRAVDAAVAHFPSCFKARC